MSSPPAPPPFARGDEIEVELGPLAYGGDCVARFAGLVLFVPRGAPGDRVRVRVTEMRKRFARGEIVAVLQPSPVRRAPRCRHFASCGGCQLQHVTYEAQHDAKVTFVRDALERIAGLRFEGDIPLHHEEEYGYRTRVRLSRHVDAQGRSHVGFLAEESHRVCDIEECPVLVPELEAQLGGLRALEGRPELRSVVMAAGDDGVSAHPPLPGLPKGVVTRKVGDFVFEHGPTAFFQGNASLLAPLVERAAGTARGRLAIDLFAGVGLFTVALAKRYERVIGVEADAGSARYGRDNLARNGAGNATLLTAPVEEWLQRDARRTLGADLDAVDRIVVDPPREGLGAAAPLLARLRGKHLTYIACDPGTMARDLKVLAGEGGYRITAVDVFDLFPQTFHVEVVVDLELGAAPQAT